MVIEILKWDEENNLVYFMGTEPDEPGTRHLYQGSIDYINIHLGIAP